MSLVCRLCGDAHMSPTWVAADINRGDRERRFAYYRCHACGSCSLHPLPEHLGDFYDQAYPAYAETLSSRDAAIVDRFERGKLSIVTAHAAGGVLLEIGPSAGRFLALAQQAGFTVSAIEQDRECCRRIRERLACEVVESAEPCMALRGISGVDVLVAWHVIEHIPDLRSFLDALPQAVVRGGTVVFSAPNPRSWSALCFGRFWVHLDAPRHVTLMSAVALDRAMAERGFRMVDGMERDAVGMALNRMGWQASLGNLLAAPSWMRRLAIRLGRILALAMALADAVPGRSAAYTRVYRHDGTP